MAASEGFLFFRLEKNQENQNKNIGCKDISP